MKQILTIAALSAVLCLGLSRQAAAQEGYVLMPDSRLSIEGTSTVDDFTCKAGEISGEGRFKGARAAAPVGIRSRSGEASAVLAVPVGSFDCGKARMNRDMHEALKATVYPNIEFWLDHVEVVEPPRTSGGAYALRVAGWLSLAGVERLVNVDVRGSALPDGRLRAQGALHLRMTDFGVTPPTALLGLVRAHDQITVRFDLYAAPELAGHAMR